MGGFKVAEEIRIALDAMGGDHAPGEIVKGAVHAVMHHDGMRIILVGRQEEVRRALEEEAAAGTIRVVLEVRRSNQAAIRLYEKVGFKTVDENEEELIEHIQSPSSAESGVFRDRRSGH